MELMCSQGTLEFEVLLPVLCCTALSVYKAVVSWSSIYQPNTCLRLTQMEVLFCEFLSQVIQNLNFITSAGAFTAHSNNYMR